MNTNVFRLFLFLIMCSGIDAVPVEAAGGKHHSPLHESRPCGPDFLPGPFRFLLFQECAGADYRPICRRHDACYETPGSSQRVCDRIMFKEMKMAGRHSRRPVQAWYRAHVAYLGVRTCGWIAWRAHQNSGLKQRKAGG